MSNFILQVVRFIMLLLILDVSSSVLASSLGKSDTETITRKRYLKGKSGKATVKATKSPKKIKEPKTTKGSKKTKVRCCVKF